MKNEDKITIHKVLWYFVIFSILGIIIETVYCYVTTGVLESRRGLIWGPFCPVYGVSAVILLTFLNPHRKKNIIWIFIYGFIIGSVSEYILSYGLEAVYGIRFWDYGYVRLNLNGRICIQYSIYWGILSVVLIKVFQPFIDKLISKMDLKFRNILELIILLFFILNNIFTIWGIQTYENRVVHNKSFEEKDANNILQKIRYQMEEKYFTNERMSTTFPNLRIKDDSGEEVWIKTLIKDEN